jgi:two-component system response regulator FixJ
MNATQKHIYLVDDDDVFRKSLVRLLASVGYSAEPFSSAQSFLDSVPVAHKTGVLIMDLRMPGMNGFELQKRMGELASRLQIITITGDAHPGDREHAINSGAIGFLQKPFEEDSLLELIGPAMKNGDC